MANTPLTNYQFGSVAEVIISAQAWWANHMSGLAVYSDPMFTDHLHMYVYPINYIEAGT